MNGGRWWAAIAGATGVLSWLLVVFAAPEAGALVVALLPLALGALGLGLWTGRTGAAAAGVGVLAVLVTVALLGGDPPPVVIGAGALGVWLTGVASLASLVVRADEIDPAVAATMVRWASGLTVAGVAASVLAGWSGRHLPERGIGTEALGVLALVLLVSITAGVAAGGGHRQPGRAVVQSPDRSPDRPGTRRSRARGPGSENRGERRSATPAGS